MAQETIQAISPLEARLVALEAEVTALKQRMDNRANWLDDVIGSTKDMSDFDEVVRYGREARRAQSHSDDSPA
jgi:phosphopantetheine adenylyltransferase